MSLTSGLGSGRSNRIEEQFIVNTLTIVQKQPTMTSAGGTATARSIVPRLVRLLSSFHAAKKDQSVAGFAWSKAFSRECFPKTLATICVVSFGVGFFGMHRWQQNRQWEWERKQEELEAEFYKIHVAKNDTKLSRKFSVNTVSI